MNTVSFPIVTTGMTFADRSDVFRYVVENFAAYYDAVDIVRVDKNDALILSSHDDAPYFNFCIHHDGELKDCMEKYRPVFAEYNRTPLIYITPASTLWGHDIGLEKFADDAFMFLEDKSVLENYAVPDSITVELTTDEEAFIRVWGDARRDPNNIYGVANDAMINGMRRFFHTPPAGFDHFAPMAYIDGRPVANVVSVYNKDFLLVVGLGVLKEYRNTVAMPALMKDIVARAAERGIKTITAQTEAGSHLEKIYKMGGFVTKFNGIYYKM
ncbi:MAG: hypothetical protein FWC51_02685 [Proteobacteria bacterium]|nr:hypothetical protein [Pseudomonadota bacterium]